MAICPLLGQFPYRSMAKSEFSFPWVWCEPQLGICALFRGPLGLCQGTPRRAARAAEILKAGQFAFLPPPLPGLLQGRVCDHHFTRDFRMLLVYVHILLICRNISYFCKRLKVP